MEKIPKTEISCIQTVENMTKWNKSVYKRLISTYKSCARQVQYIRVDGFAKIKYTVRIVFESQLYITQITWLGMLTLNYNYKKCILFHSLVYQVVGQLTVLGCLYHADNLNRENIKVYTHQNYFVTT